MTTTTEITEITGRNSFLGSVCPVRSAVDFKVTQIKGIFFVPSCLRGRSQVRR